MSTNHQVDPVFVDVLRDAVAAIEGAGIPHVLMGGCASAALARPRWTHDIDFFVTPQHARDALDALEGAGFRTEETFESWLYKGFRDEILVDVLFKSSGDIYLDDAMLERARPASLLGVDFKVISPEDLIVIKAIAHAEHSPRHWYDALGLIAAHELDWDYLGYRARHGVRRVLSLLIYAHANDLPVPIPVINALYEQIYSSAPTANGNGAGARTHPAPAAT